MIAHTNDFKNEIAKFGREIDFKIAIHINDKIITQDNKFLITQDNMHLLVEQYNEEEVDAIIYGEDIYNASIVRNGNLLSTMMKEVDFEINEDLRIGNVVDCSFGLKVNDAYEYIDYGRYIIYSKERNEDTDTYSYVAYDSMLFSMIEVDDTSIIQGVTVKTAIENICDKVGLSVTITAQDVTNMPNLNKTINEHAFDNINMTYRDVLDQICQCLGVSMVSDGKVLYLKTLNKNIVDTFDEEYLNSINVSFNQKYMINSVVLSRSEDSDTIYRRDDESVFENGVHEFKIKDNLIMNFNDREDYIDEIFDQLNGVEYYLNDLSSTGITYLEPLDFYNIMIGDKTYRCLLLNDEINIDGGLEENIYTEQPEETTTDYTTSSKTDKEVSFIVDKQGGQIKAKVSKGDVINEINLDESGASINANKVNITASDVLDILANNTINLTSKNIIIDSTNFTVDASGNMTAKSGTFKGTLNTSQDCTVGKNLTVGTNQSSTTTDTKKIKFTDNTYLERLIFGGTGEKLSIFAKNMVRITAGADESNDPDLNLSYDGFGLTSKKSSGGYSSVSGVPNNLYMRSSDGTNETYINVTGTSIYMSRQPSWPSDIRKKKNIKDIDINWIDELKVKEYEYKDSDKKEIGLIAQDYENKEYAKYFLDQDEDGYYSIRYGNITNALIQYCQEMKKEINSLKEEIKQLKESDK